MCTFEFIKPEETTWRDFTIMGDTGTGRNSPLGSDGAVQDGITLFALRQDLKDPKFDSIIMWSSDNISDGNSNETVTISPRTPIQQANSGYKQTPLLVGFFIMYFMF